MNSADASRTHNDAPKTDEKDNGFSLILELTKEEKKELLNLWYSMH